MPSHPVNGQHAPPAHPSDPEVTGGGHHRRYSTAYKLRILEESARQKAQGQLGAFLRREGLWASTLRDFQRQRDQGLLVPPNSPAARQQQAKQAQAQALAEEVADLRRQNRQLTRQLRQAQLGLEIATKACELLGLPLLEAEG